jgi:hypothetical protein
VQEFFSFCTKGLLILGAVGIRCIGLCRTHARETRGMSDGLDLITSSFSALVYYGAHESKEEDERKRKKGQEGR